MAGHSLVCASGKAEAIARQAASLETGSPPLRREGRRLLKLKVEGRQQAEAVLASGAAAG
jgi:hypothetical protein